MHIICTAHDIRTHSCSTRRAKLTCGVELRLARVLLLPHGELRIAVLAEARRGGEEVAVEFAAAEGGRVVVVLVVVVAVAVVAVAADLQHR